jgi:hypothetical protein
VERAVQAGLLSSEMLKAAGTSVHAATAAVPGEVDGRAALNAQLDIIEKRKTPNQSRHDCPAETLYRNA